MIFSIIDKNNNELLGVMNLNLDHIHKRGELAYWIGRPYWGMDLVPKQRKHYYTMDSMSYI